VAFSPKQAEPFSTRLPESPALSTPSLRPEPARRSASWSG
jgi:hypothetical protein